MGNTKFSCKDCRFYVNRNGAGETIEYEQRYCAKLWNKGYDLHEQRLLCKGEMKEPKNEAQ